MTAETSFPRTSQPGVVFLKQLFFGLILFSMTTFSLLAQGTLTNGWTHTGSISPVGDSDVWTFAATIGDRIVIRVGEITQTGSFSPRLRLQNPSAVLIASSSSTLATEVSVTATNTGTFTLTVDDAGAAATATYRLTLAKSFLIAYRNEC